MKLSFLGHHPKVLMTPLAKQKMDILVDIVNTEVGWLGLVERTSLFTFRVVDIFIPKQEVNHGTTEIDKSDWGDLWTNLWNSNVLNMENQDTKGLYLWGHSHHNIAAFPSSQDNKQITDFLKENPPPYFIRVIANKRGECKVDVYMSDDGLAIEDVGYDVETEHQTGLKEFLINEVRTKVSLLSYGRGRKATIVPAYDGSTSSRYGSNDDDFDTHLEKAYQEFSRIPSPPRPPDPLIKEGDNRSFNHGNADRQMGLFEISEHHKADEIGTVTRERKDAK